MSIVPFTTDGKFIQEAYQAALRYAENRFSAWASPQDCQDLVQEAMLKLYENIHNGKLTELSCSLSTYIIGIMKNIALKQYEHNAKFIGKPFVGGQSDDDEIDPVDIGLAEQVVTDWSNTDSEADAQERWEALRELISGMGEPCKTILWGFYWDSLSMADIAERSGLKNADVAKTQKSRCMTKVKTALENNYKILN